MSPMEFPLNVTMPPSISAGSSHSAAENIHHAKNAKMEPNYIYVQELMGVETILVNIYTSEIHHVPLHVCT